MVQDPLQVLQAGSRPAPAAAAPPRLLVAGATGVLGNEVLHRLVGGGRFGAVQVLAREPITAALRGVRATLVPEDDPGHWQPAAADVGLILFEPPRLFHDRERALWTPHPDQLPALAAWMRRSGVATLAVVLPHAPGRLPEALQRGLAGLDEHAVVSLGFDRLLIVRSARQPEADAEASWLQRLAGRMLSVLRYMVPASQQQVPASRVAHFVSAALRALPPGTHIAPPELVWRASRGDTDGVVAGWLAR